MTLAAHSLSVLQLTFLGTSSAQPTIERNLSATALKAGGELILVDCGEGTQRQMLRFGTGFDVDAVFFTHLHADHYLGIIGFVRTLAMLGREQKLELYCPEGSVQVLKAAIGLGLQKQEFPVNFHELAHGDVVSRKGYRVRAVQVEHRIPALGYVVEELDRMGSVDAKAAGALGIRGPQLGKLLENGELLTDGRRVLASEVMGPSIPGRRVAFSGDTRPVEAFAQAAKGADVMVHEATFSDAEQDRAEFTFHSTAREAAGIASKAGVRRLVLNHLSARFSKHFEPILKEAQETFPGEVEVAFDGLVVDVEPHA